MKPLLIAAVALLVAASAMAIASKEEETDKAQCEELLREYRVGQRLFPKPETEEYKHAWGCIELVGRRQRRG
tara:strand:- start:33509 stop:33724 length:216 start_codon:yes stop_codon:yes gene_type:complete